jgi:putative addiction module component (TIGR02574 family)
MADLSGILTTINAMDVEDRIRLVQEIWDGIPVQQRQPELTDAQRQELDDRLARHAAAPHEAVSWEEVKARAEERLLK